MAKRIRSEQFLPEIFQTPANKQLLRTTLDQLYQNPKLKPTQGYIGRKIGPGVTASDNYVLEPTETRTNYQLEPGVVQLKPNTNQVENAITYPGIIDSLQMQGADVSRHDRLFNSEYYSFDPFVDYDKYVNFGQYYWVPQGPDSVDVFSNSIPVQDDFDVEDTDDGYTFSGEAGTLPTLSVVREGNYTFNINSPGNNFWIQSVPGVSGVLPFQPNQSSRQVLGVSNNGEDSGTVRFDVPAKDAQNFYFTLSDIGATDLIDGTLKFTDINNQYVDEFLAVNGGIDGISDLENRTLILTTTSDSGWEIQTPFDTEGNGYGEGPFDDSTPIATDAERYVQWRINFNYADPDRPYMELTVNQSIANLSKTNIEYGTNNAGATWYKNAEGTMERQPLITANSDILYYQDGSDDTNFGIIRIVDQENAADLNISEILGKTNYTSPNGVVFTNGLKVRFIGTVVPASYANNEYYVEGVGASIDLLLTTNFVTPEKYTASSSVPYDSKPYDEGNFDETLNAPTAQDYLTVNRASIDRNAWSRSNRWFHIDVLDATATYNNVPLTINNDNRAKRPILEFRKNLKLFNAGTEGINSIDIIDFSETDAFSNINGTIGYSIDGYSLISGSQVIFAADADPEVRNKIYEVQFVELTPGATPIIDLQPASLTTPDVPANTTTVVMSGNTQQGKAYWFNGTNWISAQQKTKVNQAPLFDIFDSNGYSYSDITVYPSSTFVGTKLFSYAVGSGATDTIIEQPLKYSTIANVGDIVFDNNLYVDTFVYVSGTTSVTKMIDEGTVRQYNTRTTFDKLLGWQTSFTKTVQRQSFSFEYNAAPLVLDVQVIADTSLIPVKVYVEGQFVLPEDYTYATNVDNTTTITFNTDKQPVTGTVIEVQVISDTESSVAFYTIPVNLESNALNENSSGFTLGTVRKHYESICQNLENFSGKIHGANNVRDLGNVVPFGGLILQQSAPLSMMTNFINGRDFEFFRALEFNAVEYNKTKNKILNYVAQNDWQSKTTAEILDDALEAINAGKNQFSPFYWTDAIPSGPIFELTTYTVSAITTNVFDTLYSYNMFAANYAGILVYYTPKSTGVETILTGNGHDYTVAADGPRITINTDNVTLATGDIISIREYKSTSGSYVPATPSMMGMYEIFKPEKFLDNTYVEPQQVIRGHDGSITIAWDNGDFRNDVLLEFENRVYNNIKISEENRKMLPIKAADVIPGQFRTTDYSAATINSMLSVSFLSWAGGNRVPYKDQDYIPTNEFTWNYSNSTNRLSGDSLLGGWRAIYFQLYDTDSPDTRPWEMLGLFEKPSWWNDRYGPAPYTSGNLVLWEDLAAGRVADPIAPYVRKDYVRPGLLDVIPTDSQGRLLSPFDSVVGNYDQNSFKKSWVVGDMGPAETAWKRSSYYPFAIQRLLALTKPADYFSLYSDRDAWDYNAVFGQYLLNNRFRLNASQIGIYGNGTIKNSYINFIVDYNRVTGLDSTAILTSKLANIDIRLCYRMAAFSDQNYLKIFSEKSSPNSLNASLLLPDESYQLFLYQNPSFSEIQYSSVIVQRTTTGYTVSGYSTTKPYFSILESVSSGNFNRMTVNGETFRVANTYSKNVVTVPYGYEFSSKNAVVDFLVSYGKLLESQGMEFDTVENTAILNWEQMAQEFLYWAGQGWIAGSLINLNPAANILKLEQPNSVVESLKNENINDILLDQNYEPLMSSEYAVERLDNELKLIGLNNQTFSYLNARFTSYEHIIVFDNVSIFNDLVYEPKTAARQSRLLLNGYTVYDWNGTLDAQGFILNEDNIEPWVPNKSYTKGQIVLYKNRYWSAVELLAPTEKFDFSKWIKSDYNKIQKGLLPNLSSKASGLQENYDIHTANLEQDATLLGLGLIGFRPRQYMQNLNLDDISQAGLYSQFLGTKGTLQAAEIFTSANLGKDQAEYEIFENWAIQRGLYGASANRSYYELQLDESKLLGNPTTIDVVDAGETSSADQSISLNNIWKQSYKITDTNILPTIDQIPADVGLPSAGYVNYDDVDIKVFNYSDLTNIILNMEKVTVGTNVWVAKDNRYDWNIYRTNVVNASVVRVFDNLDGTCTVTFDVNHGLSAADRLIVKYFNSNVDGAYIVKSVPSLKTLVIDLMLLGNTTDITGDGRAFVLESVRVKQPADISSLSFVDEIQPTNEVWVDNSGNDTWEVLEKINPFGTPSDLDGPVAQINARFGTSIAQGLRNQGLVIGAPGYNSSVGAITVYNKGEGVYVETATISPATTGFNEFGSSLAVGGFDWAIVGAPASDSNKGYAVAVNRNPNNGNYRQSQIFVGASGASEQGYGVAISNDERWMYISSPADNNIDAYNLVNVQSQSVEYTGDAVTTSFAITPAIVVSGTLLTAQTQIGVTVNNIPKLAGVDWNLESVSGTTNVKFTTALNNGDDLRITRLLSYIDNTVVAETTFDTSMLYTVTDIYSFAVYVNNVLQRPGIDYTFVGNDVVLSSPATGTVFINSQSYWKHVDTFTVASVVGGARLGQSISTTTDGRQIMIGAPDDTVGSDTLAGTVHVMDRSVERFQVTDATVATYTVTDTPNGPVSVTVNGNYLIPTNNFNNPQFSVAGNVVTIGTTANPVTLNVGDIIEIETNNFRLMQSIQSTTPGASYSFGSVVKNCPTNCSLYIGVPNDSAIRPEAGSVERWANQSRLFGTITGTVANPVLSVGDSIRINNYYVTLTGTTVASLVNDINGADIPNVLAVADAGKLLLTLQNVAAGDEFIKLQVLPGVGTAYDDLGIAQMVFAQKITSPLVQAYGHFGTSASISNNALTLVVGAPDSTAIMATTFDTATTDFDSDSTPFSDPVAQSGVAITFDFLNAANPSITNFGKFVYGQQIFDTSINSLDKFGTAVDYRDGTLLVGAPNDDLDDSTDTNSGRTIQIINAKKELAWKVVYKQEPVVNTALLNSVFLYDKISSNVTNYLDFIDPLNGKILGSAQANIDYTGGVDPAAYNTGTVNNFGSQWNSNHLGEMWWDLSTVRFIDYHQDTIEYKARRWGQLFEGSVVDVYQWTENTVPPSEYAGIGEVYSTTSYTMTSMIDSVGTFVTYYYYWVKGITSVSPSKTLSAAGVTQYIANPRSSGISYAAALSPSTTALYNCNSLISAKDTILHIEFDKIANTDNVHAEYDLITVGNPSSFLGAGLYRKLLDSFCGEDTLGNIVPDATLSIADKYGVNFRPRQSMFKDRFLALENYLSRANKIMALYPLTDSKKFDLLNSEEPEPTKVSGAWDKRVATYAELTYQDLQQVPVGYIYLVASDSTQQGLWTTYTVQANKTLLLSRVQTYDTKLYWNYVDWVAVGYDASVKPTTEVAVYSDLLALTPVNGQAVKVTANSFGKSEIYQWTSAAGEWVRVQLTDGTVAISNTIWDYAIGNYGFDTEVFDAQRFDQAPNTETRQILKALNEEIFTTDLEIYRNELLIQVFEFITTEQLAPDWLFKTSLIDVSHKIRDLLPYPIYKRDNQDFVSDYIEEVKPYHVQIREFNLRYEGIDSYNGSATDFDVPAYYDELRQGFISPILDNNVDNPSSVSSFPSTDPIWQTWPYSQWFNNYLLELTSVTVLNGGTGYTVPPQVIVTGDATTQATMEAKVNSAGNVISISVLTPGSGYTTTPIITISGGNGVGATAIAVLAPSLIRDIVTTIKYDRITYNSQVVDWQANTVYTANELVRYPVPTVGKVNTVQAKVYQVITDFTSASTFDPENFTVVDPTTLDGADRTIGMYTPTPNQPGRELAQLMAGIDYPGVQVQGPDFDQNTGFDVGNYDVNPFDNLDFGPEGLPTYSTDILDVIYESSFVDSYLGIRATDINVEGGEFIDTYSSHAPEELVPGSEFDTLDLKVYTRPGSDWSNNGHGFDIKDISVEYTGVGTTVSFANLMQHPVELEIYNELSGQNVDPSTYTINWVTKVITFNSGNVGNVFDVQVYGLGGGSQLYKESFVGSTITNATQRINVAYTEIAEMVVFVNGALFTNYTYAASGSFATDVTFNTQPTSTDWVTIVALGVTTPTQLSWSAPQVQRFIHDGSTSQYTLTKSLQGTNIVNMVVERNGLRLRAPEGIEYTSDGSSLGPYYLSTTGKTNQGLIADNDVLVYVDNVQQNLAVDWTLSEFDGSSDRYVEFNASSQPADGAEILIAVTTEADYTIVNTNDLLLRVGSAPNTTFTVYTFNDTSEQNIITKVYQGPTTEGATTSVAFDESDYDVDPFDYTLGISIETNNFALGRLVTDAGRLFVSLNGKYLKDGVDFELSIGTDGLSVLTISGGILGPIDVLVVTIFTMSVVPDSLNFRIFQDMLGNQKILKLNSSNTTELTSALAMDDDVVYVKDASKLSAPNLESNIFGQMIVGAERITYRTRNLANNTVSGLRRGVAGTGAMAHVSGESVSDVGLAQQLPSTYQQKTTTDKTNIGDGSTTTFIGSGIVVPSTIDSTELDEAVRVSVGGAELINTVDYTVTQVDATQVEVTLTTAPTDGVEIDISIVNGNVMYKQGNNTASNGIALQDQTTVAALFLKDQG